MSTKCLVDIFLDNRNCILIGGDYMYCELCGEAIITDGTIVFICSKCIAERK